MVIIWFVLLQTRDLQIIMRYLEHWAHRLFPKMPFDEVLERIEKLGTKNEVKVRLSTPINANCVHNYLNLYEWQIWWRNSTCVTLTKCIHRHVITQIIKSCMFLWLNSHFSFMQTCIKRMRLDMPILNDEFVGDDEEREEGIPGSEVSTCSFNFRNLFLQRVCWS